MRAVSMPQGKQCFVPAKRVQSIFSAYQILVQILANVRRQFECSHKDEEQAQQYGEALQYNCIRSWHFV